MDTMKRKVENIIDLIRCKKKAWLGGVMKFYSAKRYYKDNDIFEGATYDKRAIASK